MRSTHEMQGVLRPSQPIAERIYAVRGVIRPEDLDWPNFDPQRAITMPDYLGEIGARMAISPRQSSVVDEALQLYRNDFRQAEPINLVRGLYFPVTDTKERPKKLVVRVSHNYCDLNPRDFPGQVSFGTGVAVPEKVYEEIVQNAPFFANKISTKTEGANLENPNIEGVEDLGGESVFYALADKHELLETRDQELLKQRAFLAAVYRSVIRPEPKRIANLEPYRLRALEAIQEMARVACKGLGYGTNQTQNTLNAIASNIHRSPDRARWMAAYSMMAIGYNDAVRGKINQSIHGILSELEIHKENLINNIDREYVD